MSFLHVQRGFRSWRLAVLNVGLPSFQKKTFFQSLSSLVSVIRFSLSLCYNFRFRYTHLLVRVAVFRLLCPHLLLSEFSTFYQLFNIYEWVGGVSVCKFADTHTHARTHSPALATCQMTEEIVCPYPQLHRRHLR